jgi:hypothetical protein
MQIHTIPQLEFTCVRFQEIACQSVKFACGRKSYSSSKVNISRMETAHVKINVCEKIVLYAQCDFG